MRFARDRRKKRWPARLSDPGDTSVDVTFDPSFWDREINAGDRRTLVVQSPERLEVGKMPPDHLHLRLGETPRATFEAWGPVVHADVLAIYGLSEPGRYQVEIKVTSVHEPRGALDPRAAIEELNAYVLGMTAEDEEDGAEP